MSDIQTRVAILEEKVETHEKMLVERRRQSDKTMEILEHIRLHQQKSNGFMAGIAAAISMIWALVIAFFDKITSTMTH